MIINPPFYPGPSGETVTRLLGTEDAIIGVVCREVTCKQQSAFIAYAHEWKTTTDTQMIGLDLSIDNSQHVPSKWAVKDVCHMEVPVGCFMYDLLTPGVELGLRVIVEVIGSEPLNIEVGQIYSVVDSSTRPDIIRRDSFHGSILVYMQQWRLCDAEG